MRTHLVGVDHLSAPLSALASLSSAEELAGAVMGAEPRIAGAVLLSTCNRFEITMDVADEVTPADLLSLVSSCIFQLAPTADQRALDALRVLSDDDAIRYLFDVGAGLNSAVIGDKQVAGQLRRAYELASDRGQCTARLHRLFHNVLRASRAVASTTSLGAVGRSAAGVGLDMALGVEQVEVGHVQGENKQKNGLNGGRVLLIGTGAFARVVVAELADRNVGEITCWSASGRALDFAAHHPVRPIPADGLIAALAEADLVVTCSGNGVGITAETLLAARPELAQQTDTGFPVIDLSLAGDIAEDAAKLPGLHLVSLQDVSSRTATMQSGVIAQARRVVADGVAEHLSKEHAREADPLVMALRHHVTVLVDEELSRVRSHETPEVAQAVERSLRHAIGVMLHTPMVRVAQFAEQGRLDDCAEALDVLFGLEVKA